MPELGFYKFIPLVDIIREKGISVGPKKKVIEFDL